MKFLNGINPQSLPLANSTTIGGVKQGVNIKIDPNGAISLNEGMNNIANGNYSHTEGYNTAAGHVLKGTATVSQTDNIITITFSNSVDYSLAMSHKYKNIIRADYYSSDDDSDQINYIINSLSYLSNNESLLSITYKDLDNFVSNITKIYGFFDPDYSHAEGNSTRAYGNASHAEGIYTIASGEYSHAEGYITEARGYDSHSEGNGTIASGEHSHAEGNSTRAYGNTSHAEGENTFALGERSHAEGYGTVAGYSTLYNITSTNNVAKTITLNNVTNLAVGDLLQIGTTSYNFYQDIPIKNINGLVVTLDTNYAIGSAWKYAIKKIISSTKFTAHAEGYSTIASGSNSHAEGDSTIADGNASHAEGYNSKAKGNYSHTEGYSTIADGNNSHAEGYYTNAGGSSSHAEGIYTSAASTSSHAEGYSTTAIGNYSHAEGANAIASGDNSHAEGYYTKAEGNSSHAEGRYTVTNVYSSHVQGIYNKTLTGNLSSYSSTSDAFVIGNGTNSSTLSNAFRVTFDGRTYGLSAFNSTGADYAEYFEWLDGNQNNEDRVGYFVTLEGEKIRKANSNDDYILGVISVNPSVIGDSHQDDWNNKYITDEWGRIQYHYVDVPAITEKQNVLIKKAVYEEQNILVKEAICDQEGNEIESAIYGTQMIEISPDVYEEQINIIEEARQDYIPIYNPQWDSSKEYIPREQRKEWDAVGIMGKLLIRDDGTCRVNGYCKPDDEGIATNSSSGYRVMKRIGDNIIQVFIK